MRHLKPEWKKHPLRIASSKSENQPGETSDLAEVDLSNGITNDQLTHQAEILDRVGNLLEKINELWTRLDYYSSDKTEGQEESEFPETASIGLEGGAE